ncbi:MAG: glycosyltransferase [bacterium]|nr:glycosyltransferase [bacterium]
MIESLNSYLLIIGPYFPLGIVGVWRWSVWAFKGVIAHYYRPVKNNGYQATLSVITPVYNEDPKLFRQALESWQQNKPEEIIAVIDHQDKLCIEVFKDFAKNNRQAKLILIVTTKPGKRPALACGIKVATSEIVALVDSDTVWDEDIRARMLAPFIDPKVGGVGTRQDVLETDTLAKRLFNIHLDHRYFDEMPFLAKSGNALTCLSGRTALYRHTAIISVVDEMVNETFWGKQCISGEDKCLTRLVQAGGWHTRYQMNVCVRTHGMPKLSSFFKQQVRWIRNSWRSDLKSLTSGWIWRREKMLAFHMVDRFIQPFTLMFGPIYLVLAIIWGQWLAVAVLIVWWHFSRAIKIYPHLRQRPSDLLILPAYVLSTYIIGVIKIYDLFTINEQGWITRWDKDRLAGRRYLKPLAAYLGTVAALLLLGLGAVTYKQLIKTSPVDNVLASNCQSETLTTSTGQVLADYTVERGDTLFAIARRYNADRFAVVAANKDTIPNPDYLTIGQPLKIPVNELNQAPTRADLFSFVEPMITFDEASQTISVQGSGSIVTLPKIYNALNSQSLLESLDDKVWLLKANLLIGRRVTLVIDNQDASWLKLKSDQSGFVSLQSNDGNILIRNTKITSWDNSQQAPDFNYADGRSFILARQNGRLDIINSELAYLGYEAGLKSGVAWHTSDDPAKHYLITGQVAGSKFSNNYADLYLSGATGVESTDNNQIADNNDCQSVK